MLDTLPIPDRIPAVEQLTIKQIVGQPREYTTELLRLFNEYPHDQDHLRALGIKKHEMSTHLVSGLPRPGGFLLVADTGGSLQGLIYLEPDLEESALLGYHIWELRHLIVDPVAPADTIPAMLDTAVMFLGGPADFLKVRLPSSDFISLRRLRDAGFQVVGGELVGVIRPDRPAVHQLRGGALVTMKNPDVRPAAGLVRECTICNPYLNDPRFDRDKVLLLQERRLTRCLRDPDCDSLVIQQRGGEILGFATYELDRRMEADFGRRIARIHHVCAAPDSAGNRQADLLHNQALAVLWEEGVEAVTTRIPIACENTIHGLNILKKIGYQVTRNDLLLHRWLTDPKKISA
jgi:hypothetical protein